MSLFRKFSLILVFVSLQYALFAAPVDSTTAYQVAKSFYYRHCLKPTAQVQISPVDLPDFAELYLFKVGTDDGFILVAADNVAKPVLAYSFDGGFSDKLHSSVHYWFGFLNDEIRYAVDNHVEADKTTLRQWESYTNPQTPAVKDASSDTTCVPPLMTTTWAQSPYYNKFCPQGAASDPGQAVTGCTATAMGQVMYYWKHPKKGHGSHCYESYLYGTLCADFENTTYQWSRMTNSLSSSSHSFQVDAVATLIYHCGVAVEMDYSPSGSGALTVSYGYRDLPCAQNALVDYFYYKSSIDCDYRDNHRNPDDWADVLKQELNKRRPIIYTGYDSNYSGGHAFVCDGYDSNSYFHFNWGWDGYYDGFYAMDALTPGNIYTFNFGQAIVLGIEPDTASDPVVGIDESATTRQISLWPNPTRGRIEIQSSSDTPAGISLITVFSQQGTLLRSIPTSDATTSSIDLSDLPAGIYTVVVTTSKGPVAKKVVLL